MPDSNGQLNEADVRQLSVKLCTTEHTLYEDPKRGSISYRVDFGTMIDVLFFVRNKKGEKVGFRDDQVWLTLTGAINCFNEELENQ